MAALGEVTQTYNLEGRDSHVLTVGVSLVVVGTLLILAAIIIAIVVLLCLVQPQGRYTWKSKVVT